MWKILIADDEPKIRRGLINLFDWNNLNIEIIGEAEDGEIALNIAQKEKPDIILTDICMPFLNGLDFIEKISSVENNPIIIIISGYNEFAYAQRALKLKVFDYILKPVDNENLEEVILKAIEDLNKRREQNNYLNWTSKQLDDNLDALKQKFLEKWLNDKMTYGQLSSELSFFNITFHKNIGLIVIRLVEKLGPGVSVKGLDKKSLNLHIKDIAYEVLNQYETKLIYIDEEDNIVIVTNVDNDLEWFNLGNIIEEKIYVFLSYTVIVNQKKVLGGMEKVAEVYKLIIEDIKNKIQYKPIVLLAQKYIDSNYFLNELKLEDVSAKFSVSPSYLSKLLKQQIGVSFSDYLTSVRINRSMIIMGDPTVKIYQVAELVGYSNQHYFCKAFKKVMGFSPTEYRENLSN